jgi:hypothetical protein
MAKRRRPEHLTRGRASSRRAGGARAIVIVENGLEATPRSLRFYGATVFQCYTPAQASVIVVETVSKENGSDLPTPDT